VASRGDDGGPAIRDELAAVLPRLCGVERTAWGYMACCPAHDDHTPSLSLRVTERGLLWHCFAGCSYKSIQLALMDPAPVDPAVWDRLAATRRGRSA
jgi:putative DNA primase/helicase